MTRKARSRRPLVVRRNVDTGKPLVWRARLLRRGVLVAFCEPLGLIVGMTDVSPTDLTSLPIAYWTNLLFHGFVTAGTLRQFLEDRGWALGDPAPLTGSSFGRSFLRGFRGKSYVEYATPFRMRRVTTLPGHVEREAMTAMREAIANAAPEVRAAAVSHGIAIVGFDFARCLLDDGAYDTRGSAIVTCITDRGIRTGSVDAHEYATASIARDLRAMRGAAGLSQPELARKLRKRLSMVSGRESGRITASERYIAAVLRACGLPKDWGRP